MTDELFRPTKRDCFRAQEDGLAEDELAARFGRTIEETKAALAAAGMMHSLRMTAVNQAVVATARRIDRKHLLSLIRDKVGAAAIMTKFEIGSGHYTQVLKILGIRPTAVEPDLLLEDLPREQQATAPDPSPQPAAATPAPESVSQSAPSTAPEPAPKAKQKGKRRQLPEITKEQFEAILAAHPSREAARRALDIDYTMFLRLLRHHGIPKIAPKPNQVEIPYERIAEAIKTHGSQAKAAKALGIGLTTISRLVAEHKAYAPAPPVAPEANSALEATSPPPAPVEPAPPAPQPDPVAAQPVTSQLLAADVIEKLTYMLEAAVAGRPLPDEERACLYQLRDFVLMVVEPNLGEIETRASAALTKAVTEVAANATKPSLPVPGSGLQRQINELTETVKQLAADVAGHRHPAGMFSDLPVLADGRRMEVASE
jgi:hypothetical protein